MAFVGAGGAEHSFRPFRGIKYRTGSVQSTVAKADLIHRFADIGAGNADQIHQASNSRADGTVGEVAHKPSEATVFNLEQAAVTSQLNQRVGQLLALYRTLGRIPAITSRLAVEPVVHRLVVEVGRTTFGHELGITTLCDEAVHQRIACGLNSTINGRSPRSGYGGGWLLHLLQRLVVGGLLLRQHIV